MKILLYGGMFNPIHYGHINILKHASKEYDFDQIQIIPNYEGHLKTINYINGEHRLNMIKLALDECKLGDKVKLNLIEFDLKKKLYTYDLIDILAKEQPADYYFLIGSDQLDVLDQWYCFDKLVSKVNFIVANRSNDMISDFKTLGNDIINISSTLIRSTYISSNIISVDKYIRDNGLYLNEVLSSYMNETLLAHVTRVAMLAVEIAQLNGVDTNEAYIGAMLHDIAKQLPIERQYQYLNRDYFQLNKATAHAYAGAIIAQDELHINNTNIINCISKHTTGAPLMSTLDKIIYCSDMLEPNRYFEGIEALQSLLYTDINECFKQCFIASYNHLLNKGIIIDDALEKLKIKIERNEV